MAEPTAFSTNAEDAITRTLEVHTDTTASQLSPAEFEEFYEINQTADEIIRGDYKRVALQFPDELLHDSVPVFRRLKAKIGEGRELYVLADTSYGSCCVDEVAAQHASVEAVVHYGHACLTRTSRLPVIYVFGRKPFDVSACSKSVLKYFTQRTSGSDSQSKDEVKGLGAILLKHDVGYTHVAKKLHQMLKNALNPLGIDVLYEPISTITAPAASSDADLALTTSNEPSRGQSSQTQSVPTLVTHHDPLQAEIDISTIALLYIGGESLTLTNLLMTHGHSEVFSYDPETQITDIASARTNRLLMRRYAVVQHARDADVFGILVGTLGVASYLPLIRHLRTLMARHKKKSYTISVGKLNPAKLANFLEIECFVLVACPENSVIEAKEFLRPIVTPFELEVALQTEPDWTGKYVLEFERLIADNTEAESADKNDAASSYSEAKENAEDADPDRPQFSLVTGTYRHAKQFGTAKDATHTSKPDSAVILRNQDNSLTKFQESAAGMFLQSRSYQGLETRIGEDAPGVLEQGRSGIAREYRDVDHKPSEI